MDIQMPVMDGITGTRLLQADPRFTRLPVLAMTANAMQVDRDRCKAVGLDDFVAKPFEPENLWRVLARQVPSVAWITMGLACKGEVPTDETWLLQPTPQVDVMVGLRRVLGNKPLYTHLLRQFVAAQGITLQAYRAQGPTTAERAASR